jgi:MoaA/NifB/PqqE/SkfB family radical SAM enzyme
MDMKDMRTIVFSPDYHLLWDSKTGGTMRWGRTVDIDPQYSPLGPELVDWELSTICSRGCNFCYKSNSPTGRNVLLSEFRRIFKIIPRTVTQMAFGIGDIDANEELPDILEHCRNNEVIPNITINGRRMTPGRYEMLSTLCGSVGVSNYGPESIDAVDGLLAAGATQVNIHQVLAEETVKSCTSLLDTCAAKYRGDERIAILFLLLKPRGERNTLTTVRKLETLKNIVVRAQEAGIPLGFDSCCAGNFMRVAESLGMKEVENFVEPCESSCFSYYISANHGGFPCSFVEGEVPGIPMMKVEDFVQDVWFHPTTVDFRKKLLGKCRSCPEFELEMS